MDYQFDIDHTRIVADMLNGASHVGATPLDIWVEASTDPAYEKLEADLRAELDFLFTRELTEVRDNAGVTELRDTGFSITATRPTRETPNGAWELWANVAELLEAPALKAHVSDMLLTAKVLTTPAHAGSTIDAYLAYAKEDSAAPHDIALSLARANTIARSRGMKEEELEVRDLIRRYARDLTNEGEHGPALTLFATLSNPPRSGHLSDDDAIDLCTTLESIGNQTPDLLDEAARILFRLAVGPSELKSARRWHVLRSLATAESATNGMRKMHLAQSAEKLASNYGLTDLRDRAVQVMQSITHESMGWQTLSVDLPVSKNAFRAHLQPYRRTKTWHHAMLIFLAGPPITGQHESNIALARKISNESIRAIFSRVTYGQHGLPESSDGDFIEEETSRMESHRARLTGEALALELGRIKISHTLPTADGIAGWLVDTLSSDPSLTRQFTEALERHWGGAYSEAARISVPLIERAARELLLALNEPMYRTEKGESPGHFPALDFYVSALEKNGLDPDWAQAFRIVLLSPGMNFRNLYAHGFIEEFSEPESALLLRLSGLLCTMPIPAITAELTAPTDAPRRFLKKRVGWVWR